MTRDEFLSAVVQLIRGTEHGSTGLKASTLGNLILRSIPDHWSKHNFFALKDVLKELEKRGQAEVFADDKGIMSVRLSNAPVPAANDMSKTPTKFVRLRIEVWHAFVDHLPIGKRFFQRSTGAVSMGQERPPQNESDWIAIPAISQETQKDWARQFLKEQHVTDVPTDFDDGSWFGMFNRKLAHKGPASVKAWNRSRSARVAAIVIGWCGEMSIPQSLVTDVRHRAQEPGHDGAKVEVAPESQDDIRRQILEALGRMPTHELLDIPIPGRYLIPNAMARQR
jgi:hypothetical protein